MSNIIKALRRAQQQQKDQTITEQQPSAPQAVPQAAVRSEQIVIERNPSSKSGPFRLLMINTVLCGVLVMMIGAGLWINFRIASSMAAAKSDMMMLAQQVKGQSQKISQLSEVIVRLEKAGDRQKRDTQDRLAKINSGFKSQVQALQDELNKQKLSAEKASDRYDQMVAKLSSEQESVKTLVKEYKSVNQELKGRMDTLQEKLSVAP